MKKHIIRYASFALAILGMVSCSEEVETTSRYKDAQSTPMTFAVNYPGQSRATATSFESNDKIGLYESRFQFKPGTEHLVNFIISDNPDQVKIEIGGEIQNWGK